MSNYPKPLFHRFLNLIRKSGILSRQSIDNHIRIGFIIFYNNAIEISSQCVSLMKNTWRRVSNFTLPIISVH